MIHLTWRKGTGHLFRTGARIAETEATRHTKKISNSNICTRVVIRILPSGHGSRLPEIQRTQLNQATYQGSGQALSHRPALELHVAVRARPIIFGHNPSPVHHEEGSSIVVRVREEDSGCLGKKLGIYIIR